MERATYTFANDQERLDYLKQLVDVLPDDPGVYQYFDRSGKIIYVGKAKNLKRRVSSYFIKNKQTPKTTILVSKICHIHHIVVNSEEDALLLENNLIKQHKPQYNILLKDDKTYPWIAVLNEPFPRVISTRRHVRDGSVYYGPYPSITQMRDLLDIVKQLYPLRQCNLNLSPERIKSGTYKVCLKYHIKLCCGPCEGLITEDKYTEFIDGVRSLLRGNVSPIIKQLKQQMFEAAEAMEFEKAEVLKRKVERLTNYQSKSLVASTSIINADIFSIVHNDDCSESYVNFMRVTQGQILASYTMTFRTQLDEEDDEILSLGILRVRETSGILQREIVVPLEPDTEFKGIQVTIPQSGDKKKLLELSEKNARLYKLELLKQEAIKSRATHEEKLLIQIKELLGLHELPHWMECFDNSNIQGTDAVAACVVYKDCRPSRQDYRLFNIKTVEGPDDYASMYEVVSRRYARLHEEGKGMPDLIVADGGVGQMQVIREALDDLGLKANIIGLSKDSHHRTNQILVGFPPKVVGIGKSDAVFRFFTRMQDEVHRVAITFHRNKRNKSMITSELDAIKGIGPKAKEALFKQFGGVEAMRRASAEELTNCVGKAKATLILEYFK
ncbi:MAG: excinuclease ABC subunit UvrC [Bacteroidales bacterium]|nr:excinuclease ABC subunit UvrC [Bacteroidales bacterium]